MFIFRSSFQESRFKINDYSLGSLSNSSKNGDGDGNGNGDNYVRIQFIFLFQTVTTQIFFKCWIDELTKKLMH